jgi:uncharacterized protein YbaR (Trm112 family)
MLDEDLLAILACPETKQPVHLADDDLVRRLNEAISAGRLTNREGQPVKEPIEAALVREDGRYLYPVRDDIPVMLTEEGIEVSNVA